MKRPLGWLFIICCVSANLAYSQRWDVVDEQQVNITTQRDIIPLRYLVYNTDDAATREILFSAPQESDTPVSESQTLLTVGLPDGSTDRFRIVRYEMMEPGLSSRYPEIRTFHGVSTTDPHRRIRADWTLNGLRAVIRDPGGFMYIDPLQRGDIIHRISYYRRDYATSADWHCGVKDTDEDISGDGHSRMQGDCMFRTYRLAQATTGEYSNYFGAFSSGQSAIVMSEVVTVINRVNDVYEADVAIRLVLIANTDLVFYYAPSSDPFTNNDGVAMLTQNQNNMTSVIGGSNYDIGHVFSTGGGGVASLGSVCSSNSKARGVTGGSNPVGDPFSIDYVAHEMGHQFGGSHTFNGTANSCNGNRSAASAYEPGSGSTVMAYAGICGSQNLQSNSDPYFHARSIFQIANHTAATSCEGFISMNNNAPVANALPDYSIPKSTPFFLTAQVTDADNDPLLYCWEQYDLESTSTEPPAANDIDGPLFRSFNYVTSPVRYFPRLSDLTANNNYTWEVLSSVTRVIKLRMTVKDYHNIGGCTDEDDVDVNVISTAGPFTVTSQNSATTWIENSSETITWNVANTTASPVNCSHVEIRYSTDGGFTYPVILAASEPNDGTATVTVPMGLTTQGRLMVKATNNIFFDINNANITVVPCNLTVTQLNGSGSGTLPGAVSCAAPGSLIVISGALAGQTINIGAQPLIISKNMTIQSLGLNTNITGTGQRVFEINSGISFTLERLNVTAGTSLSGGAMINNGHLTMNSVAIHKNPTVSGATLIQSNGGALTLMGSCSMEQ